MALQYLYMLLFQFYELPFLPTIPPFLPTAFKSFHGVPLFFNELSYVMKIRLIMAFQPLNSHFCVLYLLFFPLLSNASKEFFNFF